MKITLDIPDKVTVFLDMHSGGDAKLQWEKIYIALPKKLARIVFENRFNRNPDNITCSCCGEDYSVNEYDNIYQATGYYRNCLFKDGEYIEEPNSKYHKKIIPLEEYLKRKEILFIRDFEIKPEEIVDNS